MTIGTSYLTRNDTLGTMVANPAFRGFGHLLLPWNDRADFDLPLSRIARLLPYHSHVDVDTVVQALNRMIDAANAGEQIFFDIYSEKEKAKDPEKRQTGLFCFPGIAGSPYAVIAPGGGFAYVGSVHEGFPYAMKIADHGYHVFVLRYRLGNRKASEDMAAAIDFIEEHADELGVDKQNYSLWGSSAGARVVANISANGAKAYGGKTGIRPRAVVMAYTGHAGYSENDAPTFSIVGENDYIADPEVMRRRAQKMNGLGIPVAFKVVAGLGHGFGIGTGTNAEGWIEEAVRFWEKQLK
ncbi:Acetyl esterase/lipase [Trichococcus flocculiformis]|uniref:alpha/beta hydrolase n=1 Tax=Trichococcus TaxID=82802 RepID=UPI0007A8E871|nr:MULTISPECIES: alpha/beta hydrolase [Trichococcus]CZQ97195.1 alpha/beta hydrolase fold-5 [Trichococcus sp. ES5]SHF55749.1 Acetyl esterase/lipase [Trichococcus flocculiformis]